RETMDVYDQQGFAAARQHVLTDRGKHVMDAIRELVDEMQRAERTVLIDRSSAAHTSARLTLLVLMVGDLLAFARVGSSYVIAMRGLAERYRHVVAVEEARGQAERQAAELAALARDRDEARRTAQEASRLKSEFLATMSHEIRTPMTALVGYTELLGDADLSPTERAECLATVRRNGEHLMAIVNDTLDLSKIESGRMTIERIACSPFALVAEVAAVMHPRAAHDGLAFGLAISKRLAGMLGGDLQVRSVPGEGSTFTLTIDAGSLAGVRLLDHPPDLPAAAERREPSTDERRALRGRILLAEDGLDARRL